jgi:hypothetical protein
VVTPKAHIRKKLCKGILLTNENESGLPSQIGCPQEISHQEDLFNSETAQDHEICYMSLDLSFWH